MNLGKLSRKDNIDFMADFSMEINRRHILRKSLFKELKEKLSEILGDESEILFNKEVELIETDKGDFYAENKIILAFKLKDKILPSLKALNEGRVHLPTVTVDMGAIPFVTNGADIMAPGITKATENLHAGDIVAIIDEKFGKSLAIGELLIDSNEIVKAKKGKVIKNLHYVNDEIWSLKL